MSAKIPQLRIAVNHLCGKACVYCRPGGESIPVQPQREMNSDEIVTLARILVDGGIKDIKLTGGDPLLRKDIVHIVRGLKSILSVRSVHLVTRQAKAIEYIEDLISAGLDLLNFSLDSLDEQNWSNITRSKGFRALLRAIEVASRSSLPVKINTVLMKRINDHEVYDLIEYAGSLKCTIKFLDLIRDIPQYSENGWGVEHYLDLESLVEELKALSDDYEVFYQPGGLGHPMTKFYMNNGATVVVKSAAAGAWYGSICEGCPSFPCHDALMALRLTPDGRLQFCLLRGDNSIDLLGMIKSGASEQEVISVMQSALRVYQEARFFSREDILRVQMEHSQGE